MQDWAEVHRLFHREGWAKAKIAERLGMSRNTVMRLLARPAPPHCERMPAGSKLDPDKGSIVKMLDVDPKVPATVIIEHLRRDGYGGGITILKEYLVAVRPRFVRGRSYQRTTYLPGEVGHTDWWEPPQSVPVGKGASRQVFGLVTTLPHSAAHAAVFSFSKQMVDLLQGLSGTLGRLGGAPEAVVVDRGSAIVVPHSRPARLHPELMSLLGAFRIRPIILKPRTPESEGQVERTNRLSGAFLSPAPVLRRYRGSPGPT